MANMKYVAAASLWNVSEEKLEALGVVKVLMEENRVCIC